MVKPPESVKRISPKEIIARQTTATKKVSFSVTMYCPNKCAHCITHSGPERRDDFLPLDQAQKIAEQMQDLKAAGIMHVGFTGGEPLSAPQQIKIISAAAKKSGMTCGVVTSAFWANSPKNAAQTIAVFPDIDSWDISTDPQHQAYVPVPFIRNAFEAVKKSGKRIELRVAFRYPLTRSDEKAIAAIGDFANDDEVEFQTLRYEGRGRRINASPPSDQAYPSIFAIPCMTQGIMVRYDGSISPCCVSLAEERNHPFQFGNAFERPLAAILEDFSTHPLLQLIRTVGFGDVVAWLKQNGFEDALDRANTRDLCYLCHDLTRRKRVSAKLMDWVTQPDIKLKVAVLCQKLFGEEIMLRNALADYQNIKGSIPGFDEAESLLYASALGGDPGSERQKH